MREGMSAECDRCARVCGIRAAWATAFRVLREPEKSTISWKIIFRDGREKNFVSPIRTTEWGSIKSPSDYEAPSQDDFKTQELAHEPESLNIERLPALDSG